MSLETIAVVVDTTVKLLLLWILIYWGFRSYRVDSLRQRLFALREQLFDLAADGEVDFSDPAYWRLRLALNGMIRFAHRISFARLLFTSFASGGWEPEEASFYAQWRQAVKRVDSNEAQQRLRKIHHQMSVILVRHMITGSVCLLVASIGVSLVLLVQGVTRRLIDGVAEMLVKWLPSLTVLEDEAVQSNHRLAA